MILLFNTNLTENIQPPLGDGSFLNLTKCEEGWFALGEHKALIDSLGWEYKELESITPIRHIEITI